MLVGLCAAVLVLLTAPPSFAADQTVPLEDNAFRPPGVAVKPGESVTWRYDSNTEMHNVRFEDGAFTNPPVPTRGPWGPYTRTFASAGTYRYYCENHGGPGGTGMSGIVYVNDAGMVPGIAPTAAFTLSPSVARPEQNVRFDAAGTSDPDGTIVRHEWDLDGNGSYETDTGVRPVTALSYATSGVRTIKLRVTDSQGYVAETTRQLSVTNQPSASFTVSPSPALAGQMVSFNGSASSDLDGTIARYQWDLDGDGSFETDTGATPTTSRSYPSTGALTVRLRVTDNLGATAETTRPLSINASAAPPAPSPSRILPNMVRPGGTAKQSGGKIVLRVRGRMIGTQGRSCQGRVTIGVRFAGNRRVTRRARMGSNCRYSARISFPLRRLPRALRSRRKALIARVAARFRGNAVLRTDLSPTRRLKVRR